MGCVPSNVLDCYYYPWAVFRVMFQIVIIIRGLCSVSFIPLLSGAAESARLSLTVRRAVTVGGSF